MDVIRNADPVKSNNVADSDITIEDHLRASTTQIGDTIYGEDINRRLKSRVTGGKCISY